MKLPSPKSTRSIRSIRGEIEAASHATEIARLKDQLKASEASKAKLYGQAGGAYQNAAQLGFGGANALVNLDPYQRALGTGVQLGSGIQGQSGQMIGQAYASGQQLAGDVASFNTNMQASMYNSALNNNAALGAANQASKGQLLGAGIGAGGAILGGVIAL